MGRRTRTLAFTAATTLVGVAAVGSSIGQEKPSIERDLRLVATQESPATSRPGQPVEMSAQVV